MHADCRMVEKDVDMWLTEADKALPAARAAERVKHIEEILRTGFGDNSNGKYIEIHIKTTQTTPLCSPTYYLLLHPLLHLQSYQ
jgi:hypothetical protein